jgi:DNA-binding GntR family transcriptional regulator
MDDIKLDRIKTQKKSDTAYQVLFEKIISKSFFPGQRLDLSVIEEQLGISRMPLRLALNSLEHEGLVEIVPQSGTFVANPSSKNIADSLDLRLILECHAIELAVKFITEKDLIKLNKLLDDMAELIKTENSDSIYQSYIQIDTKFHKEIAIITGNNRLVKAVEQENIHIQGSRKLFDYPKDDLSETVNEHRNILAGLSKRDAVKSKKAMCTHLHRVKKTLMKLLDSR